MREWMRLCSGAMAVAGLALALWLTPASIARAAINSQNLGAKYDANKSKITFRAYSSRATRIEVWLYKTPSGAQELARYVMNKDPVTNVWSTTALVTTLQNTYGITGTVYYGYRAWGPNWPYQGTW